jgi:hypothetical protein
MGRSDNAAACFQVKARRCELKRRKAALAQVIEMTVSPAPRFFKSSLYVPLVAAK